MRYRVFFLGFFDDISSLSHSSMASSSANLTSFFDLFVGLEDAILFPFQLCEIAKHHGKFLVEFMILVNSIDFDNS